MTNFVPGRRLSLRRVWQKLGVGLMKSDENPYQVPKSVYVAKQNGDLHFDFRKPFDKFERTRELNRQLGQVGLFFGGLGVLGVIIPFLLNLSQSEEGFCRLVGIVGLAISVQMLTFNYAMGQSLNEVAGALAEYLKGFETW